MDGRRWWRKNGTQLLLLDRCIQRVYPKRIQYLAQVSNLKCDIDFLSSGYDLLLSNILLENRFLAKKATS